jgi:hypothetical protein
MCQAGRLLANGFFPIIDIDGSIIENSFNIATNTHGSVFPWIEMDTGNRFACWPAIIAFFYI